jgi:FemAB-related protein (PEP-CTERM system-associated)
MTKIRPIQPADYQAWDAYVLAHAAPTAYLTTAWKRAVELGYGLQTTYLAAFDDDVILGVLPLVLIKPPLGQSSLVSLPFCDYGGLIADREETAAGILDCAVELAAQRRAVLEIRSSGPSPAIEQRANFRQVTDKCRMVLELPQSAAALWDSFRSKLRTKINLGIKHGLVHRVGGRELLGEFYLVFSRNMRDLGSPVHSLKWLHAVLTSFGDAAQVAVLYKDLSPVAAGIIVMQGSYVTNPWASCLREVNSLKPNMLLYWKFLEHAADRGFRFFDFGRSTPDGGTYAFKQQWGAQPAPLHWFQAGIAGAKEARPGGDIRLRLVLEWSWKRLPVAVANVVGPPIRKHISA